MRRNGLPPHTPSPGGRGRGEFIRPDNGRTNHPLSAADLTAHANAYRLEAAHLTQTLGHLRPEAAQAVRLKIGRMQSLAYNLDCAAARRAEVEQC